jgi:hypothetical protein
VLYEKGARKFGFLSMCPLGCMPLMRARNPKSSEGGDRSLSKQVIKDKKQTQMYSALGENKPQLILLNIE